MLFFQHLLDLTLEMAPWLVIGLLAAGLIKAWIPESTITRWMGGDGLGPIVRGALIGAPLPLCSCSVIPMAVGLRRNGATKSSTVAFLVSTPETGVDSIALSWSLLGPFMTIARPVCAILSGVFAGILTKLVERFEGDQVEMISTPLPEKKCASSGCCASKKAVVADTPQTFWRRSWLGIAYSMQDLWDDIAPWLAGGVVLTAVVTTWVPYGNLSAYTQGSWLAMVLVVVASMPIYVCATASTPMAAAMLFSGMTPGMVLAFLMAGPATNIAPLGIIKRELGGWVLMAYLTAIFSSAVGMGMVVDLIADHWGWVPSVEHLAEGHTEWMPIWLSGLSALFLLWLSLRPVWAKKERGV